MQQGRAFNPLIPWFGIMSAGYCAGALYRLEATVRQRRLLWLGGGFLLALMLVRAANVYGNLTPWVHQPRPRFTLLSFLDTTKYPPSLCYVLMTIGPGLILLSVFERWSPAWTKLLLAYGRVPFFYYILHIVLLHSIAYGFNTLRYGRADFSPVRGTAPLGAGVGLIWVYAIWITVVVSLYPACRGFSGVKQRRRDLAWLSYF